jgi:hypothetical protein
MAYLLKTSQIGQYCLITLLISAFFSAPSMAFETSVTHHPELIETKELIGRLKNRGTAQDDITFLTKLIEEFKLASISLQELKSQSILRIRRGTYKIEGHTIQFENMKAEQIWNKILHIISVSQSYEGNPWEPFFQSKGIGPAEKRAALLSIAIFAFDDLEQGLRMPAQEY